MINIGIIGLGRVYGYHLPDLLAVTDKFKISAVYDVSEKRTREVAASLEDCIACASYEEMLSNNLLNLILVLTPPMFHCEHAVAALNAGKHVIVEKPMALSSKECKIMIEAAKKNDVVLTVNHNHRFSGFFHYPTFVKLLKENAIGRPYMYSTKILSSWGGYEGSPDYIQNWECKREYGGGTIYSWGPHLVDMILQLNQSKPVSIYSTMNTGRWEFSGDSYSNTIITFEDASIAQIEICYVSSFDYKTFYVQGDKGLIKHDAEMMLDPGNTIIRIDSKDETVADIVAAPPQSLLHNVYDVITSGKKLIIDPIDIMRVIQIIEAAIRSSDNNEVVFLD